MTARAIMVQGTASGVGKSLITTALCRILARRGYRVAPFKAQNMSNNAAVTPCGGEIGRAQALQARAARVTPDPRMNPVLLKPLADTHSDVVVLGRRNPQVSSVHWHARRELLWPIVTRALDELRAEYDVIVIEGAGSPAEINLRESDIVNMSIAHAADAAVLLVADIDRGGAFAALAGTCALLPSVDRARIRGFILNRFRGDASLLAPAPALLQEYTGVPVLGVVPYVRHHLPEEDAFAMRGSTGDIHIAAIRLPYISNFDDFDPLGAQPDVRVHWTQNPRDVHDAHAIVLPGTRNTIHNLRWLWESGVAAAIVANARAGALVIGLCGGFQMLGTRVRDPLCIESGGETEGLGLLPIETELEIDKTTRQCSATVIGASPLTEGLEHMTVHGYEIHHGRTHVPAQLAWLAHGSEVIGAAFGNIAGAYLHGLFDNDALRSAFLAQLGSVSPEQSWEVALDREIGRIADHVEQALDMGAILRELDA